VFHLTIWCAADCQIIVRSAPLDDRSFKRGSGFWSETMRSFCACRRSSASWAIVTLLVRFMVICYTNLCPV
jgi:hypothetical protein